MWNILFGHGGGGRRSVSKKFKRQRKNAKYGANKEGRDQREETEWEGTSSPHTGDLWLTSCLVPVLTSSRFEFVGVEAALLMEEGGSSP